jgi:hypothetical protein
MELADFKCSGIKYVNMPERTLMKDNAQLKVAGELKIPGVHKCQMGEAYTDEHCLR